MASRFPCKWPIMRKGSKWWCYIPSITTHTFTHTTIVSQARRRPQPCTHMWSSVLDNIPLHRFDITVVKMYNVTIDRTVLYIASISSLQWRYKERDGVSHHRRLPCLFNRLFGCKSKKASKLRATDLCEGNSPVTGEFPSQRSSNAEEWVDCFWSYMVYLYTVADYQQ